jgi:hypothetical protein
MFFTNSLNSNTVAMIFVLLYSTLTAVSAAEVYMRLDRWCTRLILRLFLGLRFVFILIAVVLLFTLKGKEIEYGFWVITMAIYFLFKEMYIMRVYLTDFAVTVFKLLWLKIKDKVVRQPTKVKLGNENEI